MPRRVYDRRRAAAPGWYALDLTDAVPSQVAARSWNGQATSPRWILVLYSSAEEH
ncbi:MAG TPA: hypothetical protein VL991_14250 [Terracidiphilus sp.]|nr:hypothetical protein [Terracidiphilus sp.]